MLKRILLLVLLGTLLVGVLGCESSPPEFALERDDLIMINLSTTQSGFGSTGVYVFFFENYPTKQAYNHDVEIRFDESLERPVVRAKEMHGWSSHIYGVEVFFRDREQMLEYWIVE